MILINPKERDLPDTISDSSKTGRVWFDQAAALPTREDDDTLHMPFRKDMMFIPLQQGAQFAVHYPDTGRSFTETLNGMSFFAGMDESPFVTRIDTTAFNVLKYSGEGAFFDELKPDQIKLLEKIHGDEGRTTGRQGDVFFHKLGRNWFDFLNEQAEAKKRIPKTVEQDGKTDIFSGVRHRIIGLQYVGEEIKLDKHELDKVAVAEGILTAPDHVQRLAKPGPYLLARARHILSPPKEHPLPWLLTGMLNRTFLDETGKPVRWD